MTELRCNRDRPSNVLGVLTGDTKVIVGRFDERSLDGFERKFYVGSSTKRTQIMGCPRRVSCLHFTSVVDTYVTQRNKGKDIVK